MSEKIQKAPSLKKRKSPIGAMKSTPRALGLWCFDAIKMEISGGRSSLLEAYSGCLHLNDFLHQAGLITDDCWNAVKGMSTLFSDVAAITAIAGSIGSVLKTVVEGATGVIGGTEATTMTTEKGTTQKLTGLAALGGAAAEETA